MSKPTILLTGANGFLGSHLLEALLKQSYQVVVLKRSTSNLWRIQHLTGLCKSYDLDKQSIEQAFEEQQIDYVIHTACHYGRNNDSMSKVVESNLMFGLKVFEAGLNKGVKTFINTDSFLPRELNTYSLSKKQLVDWLKKMSSKIQVINLKLEHMYGPKDDPTKFMAWLVSQFEQNVAEIKLTSGVQKRDFIFIDDIVSAFMTVLQNQNVLPQFSEFEVGIGQSIEVRFFVETLKKQYEKANGKSDSQLNFGAIPYRDGEVMEFKVNNDSLKKLGWKPSTHLNQGLETTLKG